MIYKAHAGRASKYVPDATLLVGESATGQAVLAAAEGAGLVHLACHGRLRTDSPWFSSIELADGPVTVHEVTALSRPAHRWVLAACELGHPGDLVGPELEGMVGALLASGAGAEARQAIGWVVFGGLGIATIFTLILIPVIYSLLAPLSKPRAHAGVRLDRELRDMAEAPAE